MKSEKWLVERIEARRVASSKNCKIDCLVEMVKSLCFNLINQVLIRYSKYSDVNKNILLIPGLHDKVWKLLIEFLISFMVFRLSVVRSIIFSYEFLLYYVFLHYIKAITINPQKTIPEIAFRFYILPINLVRLG